MDIKRVIYLDLPVRSWALPNLLKVFTNLDDCSRLSQEEQEEFIDFKKELEYERGLNIL